MVAYRLLAGSLPFAGPTARDFVLQHISVAPAPLIEAAPQLVARPALVDDAPASWVLEALAQHRLARHEDEWRSLAEVPASSLERVGEPAVLQLLEDFGRDEKARELREQLNRLSQRHFDAMKVATGSPSPDLR